MKTRIYHGLSKHPLYRMWHAMKNRCYNPNVDRYKNYGARGITVCDRWKHDFSIFLDDMGEKPSPSHSIDRRNNNLGYSPDNCYWATPSQQQSNTRNSTHVTYLGVTKTIKQWSEITGIHYNCLYWRINAGWSIEKSLMT